MTSTTAKGVNTAACIEDWKSEAHRRNRSSRRQFLRFVGAGAAAALAATTMTPHAAAEGRAGTSLTFGNRIPRSWFWFQGLGVTEQGYGKKPHEPFAFDLALRKGGIEDYNVMTYSSVVPRISYGNISAPNPAADGTISRPDSINVTPGSVLEVIMSQQSITVPAGQTWTTSTGLGLQWAAEAGSRDTLRNGYLATYVELNKFRTRTGVAERAARVAIKTALGHGLGIRDLVPFAEEEEPTIVVLASRVDNTSGIGPLFATQITGLACYDYVFPIVGSE